MDDADGLSVGQVAARLGVSASTLRSWERRYGLAPGGRSPGGHRRYTAGDLAVLVRMHELTLTGSPPARAALAARRGSAVLVTAADGGSADAQTEDAGSEDGAAGARRRPGGPGGRGLALPGGDARARGLARAATRLDVDAATEIIEQALADEGVQVAYETLVRPVLVAAGEAWARTGEGIEVEHLFSEATMEALRHHRRHLRAGLGGGPPVLLACAPRDHHVIPLHVVSAALAERSVPSRVLGSRVPGAALAAAVSRIGARSVFVWAQVPAPDLAGVVASVPVRRPPVRVVVGGPGWEGVEVDVPVLVVGSLAEAVEALTD